MLWPRRLERQAASPAYCRQQQPRLFCHHVAMAGGRRVRAHVVERKRLAQIRRQRRVISCGGSASAVPAIIQIRLQRRVCALRLHPTHARLVLTVSPSIIVRYNFVTEVSLRLSPCRRTEETRQRLISFAFLAPLLRLFLLCFRPTKERLVPSQSPEYRPAAICDP